MVAVSNWNCVPCSPSTSSRMTTTPNGGPAKNQIRVLIIDDHALFREGLTRLLANEPDIEVIEACPSIETAERAVARHQLDVVLLDFELGQERAVDFVTFSKQGNF